MNPISHNIYYRCWPAMSLFLAFLAFFPINSFAQFSFQLTGNPVNTTGWTYGTQSYVENNDFVLAAPIGNQAGYIYYSTPQNLTTYARFTVSFEFCISNSSNPTADGIAFWYIATPPSGFATGLGIGLPNNPNGLVLVLDTWDNDNIPNNPIVSLRHLDGTSNYVEGTSTGQLASDLTSQTFIADANWHCCVLTYDQGTVTVAFDGNTPVMTGNTILNMTGYFGFSASSGSNWARHAIRNVSITGVPDSSTSLQDTTYYCQGETAVPLTAIGPNVTWYTTPVGGSPLPGAPTPNTGTPGIYTWYVSYGMPVCNVVGRDTVTVIVNPKPSPPVISVPLYCSGQQAQPMIIQSGSNVLWYDSLAGGTGSALMPVVNTSQPDTFIWYTSQTNVQGCESDRIQVTAVVRQSPVISFSFDIGYNCHEDTVHFHNQSTHATSYLWHFDDGFTDTLTHPTHIYSNQNTYSVTLKASNQYCSDSATQLVNTDHPLQAAFNTSADTVCEDNTTITFTNNSVFTSVYNVAPVYYWDFGDGSSSTMQSPVHSFVGPGTYLVTMRITDGVPCTDTAFKLIVVDSLPSVSFTKSNAGICMGDKITFTGNYTLSGLNLMQWNFGDTPDQNMNTNPTEHSYDQTGTYTVTLWGRYRACPDVSYTDSIRVYSFPLVNLGQDSVICLHGAAITLRNLAGNEPGYYRYRWNTDDTTQTLNIVHPGPYTLSLTNSHDCTTTESIQVNKDCYVDIPNAFTPNGDGVNDYFFPRQLSSKSVTSFRMQVFNRWGQIIFETKNTDGRGWDGKLNGQEQPGGVYLYLIEAGFANSQQERYEGNVTLLR